MQTFNVTGMTCGHCERAVINAINMREPTAVVRVDRAAGTVEVEGNLSATSIREAIAEEGYQVR